MSESEVEVKDVDTVIDEQVNKVIEELIVKTGIDSSLANQVTSIVTTVAADTAKVVADKLGLKMISECSLSEEQKKLASNIYDSVKNAIEGFINDPTVNSTIKITKTLGQVIKQLENTKIDGKVYCGADKKAVAIQLGRILIKEVMPDDKGEDEVLMVYDLIAEPTLEAMIEVSKVVNVAIHEMAAKCCPGLLDFLKRTKKSA